MQIVLTFDEMAGTYEFIDLFSGKEELRTINKLLESAGKRFRGALERVGARIVKTESKEFNGWRIHTYNKERYLRRTITVEMPQNEVAALEYFLRLLIRLDTEIIKEVINDGVLPSAEQKLRNRLVACGATFDLLQGGRTLQDGTIFYGLFK